MKVRMKIKQQFIPITVLAALKLFSATGVAKDSSEELNDRTIERRAAGKESNWVPTAGRDFEILFHVYGPEKSFFDKTWKLPDVETIK